MLLKPEAHDEQNQADLVTHLYLQLESLGGRHLSQGELFSPPSYPPIQHAGTLSRLDAHHAVP